MSQTSAPAANPSSGRAEVERLLEASLPRRARGLPRRELTVELVLSAAFVLLVAALVGLTSGPLGLELLVGAGVVAYAVASRVDYPIATGVAVPTQLFVVGLFALADARLVPLLVLAGLALGTLAACLLGRSRWDRLSQTGGDAMHALGPAAVFTLSGHTDATTASAGVIVAAFAAQCGVELVSSTIRDWIVSGVRPRVQVLVLAQVWAVDAALTPIGILAVAASATMVWAPLAMLPLVALVAHTARDRTQRTDRLRLRLDALQRERRRLQIAVRRIGDAFASNLDLDALIRIVSGATVEALDAEAGRGVVIREGQLLARFSLTDSAALDELLDRVEREARALGTPAEAESAGGWAIATPIGPSADPVAVVAVARSGSPFAPEERELIAYLCDQAAVSAANVVEHETLHRQALTDELTGLANHRRFQDLLGAAVDGGAAAGAPISLILLDLDDFKRINDTHGHQIGDVVLRAVGRCLRAHCRAEDEPARYGGEELAVVLAGADLPQATALAERLRRAVEGLDLPGPAGVRLGVTVSLGVATLGPSAPTKATLIAAADAALYEAKAAGKNRLHSAPSFPAAGALRRRAPGGYKSQVRSALDDGELVLHYQPKVSLRDGGLVGVEALLRWHHPEQGLLGPSSFLSQVEGSEVMPELTHWVLETAAAQVVRWRHAGLALPVAVNVTAQDLVDSELPAVVRALLAGTGARPEELRLEITEHMAMSDADRAERALVELRDLGVGLSLDDFGSGHSSLTRLRDLPVDELKLDRSFLRHPDSAPDLAVMRAAISLGRDLGLTVIGEGVEDATRFALLGELGCDLAQGFFVSPPLLPVELERWVGERAAGAATAA